ncbi:MAG: hypothetical protein AUK47_19860 [Deltaproteobacteria bacterium CG2_30_63_29]|nr:MAG: hypothetical protein AUK47_19860 [Deltaproteobacteria bacterium CG2_30_63_29]PJB42754.1 MAG: hypothetical protein CO108_11260 [Deltaproteobacteria bacterium CG_4_9_14_3_um_filter_63_12]
MRSLLFACVLMLSLVASGSVAPGTLFAGDQPQLSKKEMKKLVKRVDQSLKNTDKVIKYAAKAAQEGGSLKGRLRNAIVHQRAARAALKGEKFRVAIRLTLEARSLAGHVIKGNKAKKIDEQEPTAAETTDAEGVLEEETESLLKASELVVPDEETVTNDIEAVKEPSAADATAEEP